MLVKRRRRRRSAELCVQAASEGGALAGGADGAQVRNNLSPLMSVAWPERGSTTARGGPAGGAADRCGCRRAARRCGSTSSVLLIRGRRTARGCELHIKTTATGPQPLATGPIEASAAFQALPRSPGCGCGGGAGCGRRAEAGDQRL